MNSEAAGNCSEEIIARVVEARAAGGSLYIKAGDSKRDLVGRRCEAQCLDVSGHRGIVDYQSAELVITAANGDQLFGTYDGVMTGETSFAETMIVTGGTGRFVGASGEVEESGWFDPDSGYMEIAGDGFIIYDASGRALDG